MTDDINVNVNIPEVEVNSGLMMGVSGPERVWLPEIDESGNISWVRSATELAPTPRNIMGPEGPEGPAGPQGNTGPEGPIGPQGITGAAATILSKAIAYAVSSSGTVVPTTGWSSSVPSVPGGKFLWTRVTLTFNTGDPVISYSIGYHGANGTGSVNSVNGHSGTVVLSADDIKADDNRSIQDHLDNVIVYNEAQSLSTAQKLQARKNIGATRGKAVIFGDSLFDNTDAPYNFADYLTAQNIYESVTDYAKGGTGWGNTSTTAAGYNLFELLQNPDVLSAVSQAEDIYISLGGNDVRSRLNPSAVPEPNLKAKVTSCLATIFTENPNACIYYVSPFKLSYFNSLVGEYTPAQLATAAENTIKINEGIASCENNIKVIDMPFFDFCEIGQDGMHPLAYSAENAFDAIIRRGNYRDKKLRSFLIYPNQNMEISQATFDTFAGYINNKMVPSISDLITGYLVYQSTNHFALISVPLRNRGSGANYGFLFENIDDFGNGSAELLIQGSFDVGNQWQNSLLLPYVPNRLVLSSGAYGDTLPTTNLEVGRVFFLKSGG